MNKQENLNEPVGKNRGWWAELVADFREVWPTVLAGFVVCSFIAGFAGFFSFASFKGGYQSYGFAYLGTALFIAFVLPATLFWMERQKG